MGFVWNFSNHHQELSIWGETWIRNYKPKNNDDNTATKPKWDPFSVFSLSWLQDSMNNLSRQNLTHYLADFCVFSIYVWFIERVSVWKLRVPSVLLTFCSLRACLLLLLSNSFPLFAIVRISSSCFRCWSCKASKPAFMSSKETS